MTRATLIVIAMFSATVMSGCTVHGVDRYQGAMELGCTPMPDGVLRCAGDRS